MSEVHEAQNKGMDDFHEYIGGNQDGRRMRKMLEDCYRAKTWLIPSDLTANYSLGHELEPFWDKVVEVSDLMGIVERRITNGADIISTELTLGANAENILRTAAPGTEVADSVTLDDAVRTFTPREVVAVLPMTDQLLEDARDSNDFINRFYRMMFNAYANSVENICINGVSAGTETTLSGSVLPSGLFDGWLQQINADGTVLYAPDYSTRVPHLPGAASYATTNDKHLAAYTSMPDKYADDLVWFCGRNLAAYTSAGLGNRQTPYGDNIIGNQGFSGGETPYGIPTFKVRKFRTNHLVKGTGAVLSTNPGDTTLSALAKAGATTVAVASSTGFANTNKIVIGTDAAGTSYKLNAENKVVNGTPSSNTFGITAALDWDHASGEIVTEYATAATANGTPLLLTDPRNLAIGIRRELRIEFERKPRARGTYIVVSSRIVPMVANPNRAVLVRDMLAA